MVSIGQVDCHNIAGSWGESGMFIDHMPRDNLEVAASQVPPPRISENFMAPFNDVRDTRRVHPVYSDLTVRYRLPTEGVKSGPWSLSIT